jgi:hypothetical protein
MVEKIKYFNCIDVIKKINEKKLPMNLKSIAEESCYDKRTIKSWCEKIGIKIEDDLLTEDDLNKIEEYVNRPIKTPIEYYIHREKKKKEIIISFKTVEEFAKELIESNFFNEGFNKNRSSNLVAVKKNIQNYCRQLKINYKYISGRKYYIIKNKEIEEIIKQMFSDKYELRTSIASLKLSIEDLARRKKILKIKEREIKNIENEVERKEEEEKNKKRNEIIEKNKNDIEKYKEEVRQKKEKIYKNERMANLISKTE